MARYFGQFIDKLPFVESSYTNKQVVIPNGNLAAGFIYPLMGWAYNQKQFIGVYETEMGLNCFRIEPSDVSKGSKREERNSIEKQLKDMIEYAEHAKGEPLTDEEKEECKAKLAKQGNVPNLNYQGPKDFQRLQCDLVSYETFLKAEKTADFGCFYIDQKKVDKITKKNKEHMDFLTADYDILCQVCFTEWDEGRSRYRSDTGGMRIYSPFIMYLSHKESPETLFRVHSPDMFYKKPQLEFMQQVNRDKNPITELITALTSYSLAIHYDDPVNTMEQGYQSNNKVMYDIDLKKYPGETVVILKALMRQVFSSLTPSRKPVVMVQDNTGYRWRRFKFLSRFKNGRMAGNCIDLDNYKKFNSGISGCDEGEIARAIVKYADEGNLDTPKCVILDESVDIEEFLDECRMYTLTSNL
jgi:hypothetical protein